MPAENRRRYTVEEYLAMDAASPDAKLEYRDGEIFDIRELQGVDAQGMSGGSRWHVVIASNLHFSLATALRGTSCSVLGSDTRVQIPRKTLFAYPDLTVVCGSQEWEAHSGIGDTLANPKLIVEVLSPSTEAFDRGTKLHRYFEIASLKEYVLVSQFEHRVETFLRHDDGTWLLSSFTGAESHARFASLDVTLSLKDIFAGVEFPLV